MTLEQWYAELLAQMDAAIGSVVKITGGPLVLDDHALTQCRSVLCEFTVKYDIVREKYLAD